MTPAEIAAACTVCAAATPSASWDADGCRISTGACSFVDVCDRDDATFIAAARTGWPAALDAVERLTKERDSRFAAVASVDIAAARAICLRATPGPWTFEEPVAPAGACDIVAGLDANGDRVEIAEWVAQCDPYRDAAFIAAARTGWPTALTALEQMTTDRDAALAEVERLIALRASAWSTALTAAETLTAERDAALAEVKRLNMAARQMCPCVDYGKAIMVHVSPCPFAKESDRG